MKKTNFLSCAVLTILFLAGQNTLRAQNNTVSAGGEATGTGGTVSYSIGQIDYVTATGSDGTITQGVQQPYEIVVINGNNRNDIKLDLTVYPNPTTNNVVLSIDNFENKNLNFCLYDLQGKVILQQAVTSAQTKIAMHDLTSATYFIKVTNDNSIVKTFRIVKTQ